MTNKKAFTLIELMIVVAIIAVLTAIAIPSLLNARRKTNQAAAISTTRGFSSAAVDYSCDSDSQKYWKNGTTDFGTYFGYLKKRSGYWYQYFSNDNVGDQASCFCFIAAPISYHTGVKAVLCDENSKLYLWEIPDAAAHATLVDNNGLRVVPDFTKGYNEATGLYERIPIGAWKIK